MLFWRLWWLYTVRNMPGYMNIGEQRKTRQQTANGLVKRDSVFIFPSVQNLTFQQLCNLECWHIFSSMHQNAIQDSFPNFVNFLACLQVHGSHHKTEQLQRCTFFMINLLLPCSRAFCALIRSFQRVRLCLLVFSICGVSGFLCCLARPEFALYIIP